MQSRSHTHISFSHLGISLPYINFNSTPCSIIRDISSQTEQVLVRDRKRISLWMQNPPLIRIDSLKELILCKLLASISHKNENVSKYFRPLVDILTPTKTHGCSSNAKFISKIYIK